MRQKITPIDTEVGFLQGRDTIYYSKLTSISDNEYCITGELNGNNCSKIADKDADAEIKFSITFIGVLLFKMLELDFDDVQYASCFDLVEHSNKVVEMRARDKRAMIGKIDRGYDENNKFSDEIYHQHFVLRTYDVVYEIVAQHYDLVIKK